MIGLKRNRKKQYGSVVKFQKNSEEQKTEEGKIQKYNLIDNIVERLQNKIRFGLKAFDKNRDVRKSTLTICLKSIKVYNG